MLPFSTGLKNPVTDHISPGKATPSSTLPLTACGTSWLFPVSANPQTMVRDRNNKLTSLYNLFNTALPFRSKSKPAGMANSELPCSKHVPAYHTPRFSKNCAKEQPSQASATAQTTARKE